MQLWRVVGGCGCEDRPRRFPFRTIAEQNVGDGVYDTFATPKVSTRFMQRSRLSAAKWFPFLEPKMHGFPRPGQSSSIVRGHAFSF